MSEKYQLTFRKNCNVQRMPENTRIYHCMDDRGHGYLCGCSRREAMLFRLGIRPMPRFIVHAKRHGRDFFYPWRPQA